MSDAAHAARGGSLRVVRVGRRAIGCGLAAFWTMLSVLPHDAIASQAVYVLLTAGPVVVMFARVVAVAEDRLPWGLLASGLLLWSVGIVLAVPVRLDGRDLPFPSASHILWLAMYPPVFAAFGIFLKRKLPLPPLTVATDAAMVVAVLTAIATALAMPSILANDNGLAPLAQAMHAAYPIADGVLAALAVTALLIVGWRASLPWQALTTGTIALALADILWTVHASSGSLHHELAAALYPVWSCACAFAAWISIGLSPARRRVAEDVRLAGASLVAALAAIGVLVANDFVAVPRGLVILAAGALLLAVQRTAVTVAGAFRASHRARQARIVAEDVRQALRAGELAVHFQPQVDIPSGRPVGAEALLRWHRADGIVPPNQFLPAVEKSDVIGEVTDFVLDRALGALAAWQQAGHDMRVSVNLAAANLADPGLPDRVAALLARYRIAPERLTLEITETAAVEDETTADAVVTQLKQLRVELSIDDFGTGHSALSRVTRLPIDEIKIDRSFVRNVHDEPAVVASSIELAKALGLQVVAEGIEDHATLTTLAQLGCHIAQGYHIARPLPETEIADWLASRASLASAR